MKSWAAAALLMAVTCACSQTPTRIDSRALGEQRAPPDRFIIAAVDNAPSPFVSHAGSTPRGYDSLSSYGPTAQARRQLAQVAIDYGLHEVSA